MVELFPVRAWHADASAVEPDSLVCPVYDTLSEEDQARFAHRRHNAAGFVPRPPGVPVERFLLGSVGRLGEAIRGGAYVQDPTPGFYVYGIRYRPPSDIAEGIDPARRREEYLLLGLLGTLDFDRVGHGEVALHERTFSDRVDERLALADATGMNFAPIVAGYNLPEHRLNNRIEELLGLDRRLLAFDSKVPPLVTAHLDGTTHQLWRIDDPEAIRSLQAELLGTRLLVLDGHHRYTASARRHYDGQRTMPFVMLVEGGDRALQVLPWHRVLPGDVVAPEGVVESVRESFPGSRNLGFSPRVENMVAHLRTMSTQRRRGFVMVTEAVTLEVPGPASGDVGADFDQLHTFLEETLSVDPHELEFARSTRVAMDHAVGLSEGLPGTALLLPDITEQGIEARAFGSGALMAHKSTMFLPKVAEGVIFAPVDGIGST